MSTLDQATPTLEDTAELSKWCIALYHLLSKEHEVIGPFASQEEAETWKNNWLPKLSTAAVVPMQDPLDVESYLLSRE